MIDCASVQAESAGPSSTAAKPSRARALEEEEEEDPEGSDVSYDSDEPPQQDQSDADSDEGESFCPCLQLGSWLGHVFLLTTAHSAAALCGQVPQGFATSTWLGPEPCQLQNCVDHCCKPSL